MQNEAIADNGSRDELIAGVVMMSPAPNMNHNIVMQNILDIFRRYLKGKRCRVFGDHVDVFLDENHRFQPDITITCDRDKIRANGIHGVPDFVAEILSWSTRANDRGRKMKAYERFGVKEYWIVDPVLKSIEVYLNSPDGFILDGVYGEKDPEQDFDDIEPLLRIKVSLYEDLVVDVREIFYDMITHN